MGTQKYKAKAFAFTFRPHPMDGLNSSFNLWLKTYLQKQDFCFLVQEKQDEKAHYHGVIMNKVSKTKYSIYRAFSRYIESHKTNFPNTIPKHAIKIDYCYNDDWVNVYLDPDNADSKIKFGHKQEDYSEVKIKNLPKDTSTFYPTQEEQLKFQQMKNKEMKRKNELYIDLAEKFESSKYRGYKYPEAVSAFLFDLSYKEHELPLLRDKRASRTLSEKVFYTLIADTATLNDKIDMFGTTNKKWDEQSPDTSNTCCLYYTESTLIDSDDEDYSPPTALCPFKQDQFKYQQKQRKAILEISQISANNEPLFPEI